MARTRVDEDVVACVAFFRARKVPQPEIERDQVTLKPLNRLARRPRKADQRTICNLVGRTLAMRLLCGRNPPG
jgi:hypothetical protein